MPVRDVVVVGASAGGVMALTALVAGLPSGFPAAVLIVLHVPPYAESRLPEILARASALPVAHAQDGEEIVGGRVYVAPPDRHLLVRSGRLELSHGPRENRSRPAVDPLFRTAARAYGPRAIGVVLSGALYDGSAGLLALKSRGGMAIVQDPEQAAVDSMPRSAIRLAAVDHVVPVEAIGPLLDLLVQEHAPSSTQTRTEHRTMSGGGPPNGGSEMTDPAERTTTAVIDADEHMTGVIDSTIHAQAAGVRGDEVTIYTCPDCGGSLFQEDAPVTRFRCHVGHAYAPEVLLHLKGEELEAALWTCVRMLTEKATLTRQVARRTQQLGSPVAAERVAEQADADERHAQILRDLLDALPGPTDTPYPVVDGSAA